LTEIKAQALSASDDVVGFPVSTRERTKEPTMRTSRAKAFTLSGILAIMSQLALSPSAPARNEEPVVPIGALAHATGALEEETGGRVLEIRLSDEAGVPAFEAAVAKDDGLVYVRIASVGDDVTEIKVSDLPAWLLNYRLEAFMRSINQAELPLSEAIVRAEERASAPAIGAGIAKPLSGTNTVLAYLVETIKGKKRLAQAINAKTGQFVANAEALYEPHTPVKLARRLAMATSP
jgi:uncharacterized membrane protein YkoI